MDSLPKPFFILAPMDDVTDTVFRQIIADCARPDLFFTEFVNVDGLQSPGRPKLMHKLAVADSEKPVIAQLWGLRPDNYFKTVKELPAMGFDGVDINMGCPVKTVVKNGACAALINNRELAGEIIAAVQEAAGDDFPVSVKTRVGFTTVDLSWPEFLLTKKLNMLTIHGRTAKQMSKVPADWQLVGRVREMRDALCPATKIVGNGDVLSRAQGLKLAERYQLDGIMVGRGVFADPFVFAQKSPWAGWSRRRKLELFERHIRLYESTYKAGERRFETLRKFAKVYIHGFDGASELRTEFMETETPGQALRLLGEALAG